MRGVGPEMARSTVGKSNVNAACADKQRGRRGRCGGLLVVTHCRSICYAPAPPVRSTVAMVLGARREEA